MQKVPTSFNLAIAAVILATLVRGLLSSMVAGVLISVFILLFAATAITRSRRFTRRFAIGLGVYGGGFVAPALLLPSYFGSRALDAACGLLLVAVAVFIYLSRDLNVYFERLQGNAPGNASSASPTKDASAP